MSRIFLIVLFIATSAIIAFSQDTPSQTQAPSRVKRDSVSAYEEFSKAVSKSVNKSYSTETLMAMVFAAVLLIFLVVLYEVYRSNKVRKDLLEIAWEKFYEHVESLRLDRRDVELLSKIAKKADLQDPYSIIKSPHVFESSLEAFYEKEGLYSMSSRMLDEIRDIRRELGFLPLSKEVAYTSTRQFEVGDKCATQIPSNGPPSHKGMLTILTVKEREWSIERPQGPSISTGTSVRINLIRQGDAEYSFVAYIAKDTGEELFLSHSGELKRTQLRNWVRMDVDIPVEVIRADGDHIGDMFAGQIIDMSGGGLGIAIPAKLFNGVILKLNFELPGYGAINDLTVKVVRVAGTLKKDPGKYIHSVSFEGDVSKIQEQVVQYVFEKQRREAIARRNE